MTEKERNFGPIWNEIKDKTMTIFGLSSQKMTTYFQPIMGDEKKLVLTMVDNRPIGAAILALEEILYSFTFTLKEDKKEKRGPALFGTPAVGPKLKYTLEQSPGYLTITLNS